MNLFRVSSLSLPSKTRSSFSFPSIALWCIATTTLRSASSSTNNNNFAVSAMSTTSKDPRFRTWPITATKSLEPKLKEMGLEVPAERIDGTSGSNAGTALSDSLVSVGTAGRGGTGSFVSKDGLIVTNWHVAYDAVRRASIDATDPSIDYVRDGFVARSLNDEIEGPNYECWITEACDDVSEQVLASVDDSDDALERANKIRNVRQEIAQAAQEKAAAASSSSGDGSIRCDVVEMIPNKSYVLFTKKRLKDIRIVYVPPKALGNFGGDTDNFEWPRHTADFTLLRAYVPPNDDVGSWDGYHPDNVPYDSSNSFIRVRKPTTETNIKEDDMVFLLGFPGRTMRYAPTPRLKYADEIAVPHDVKDFTRKLALIAKHEGDSLEAALKMGSTKKGLANELKRSQGKLVMMRKLKLLEERGAEEDELVKSSQATPDEKSVKEILDRLEEIYATFAKDHPVSSAVDTLQGIYGGSSLLATGHSIHEYLAEERAKPDAERETTYRQRNLPFLAKRLTKRLRDIHLPHEAELVEDCVALLDTLEEPSKSDEVLAKCLESIRNDSDSILKDAATAKNAVMGETTAASSKLLEMTKDPSIDLLSEIFDDDKEPDDTAWEKDPFVKIAAALWNVYKRDRDSIKALASERDTLLAKLLEYQQESGGDDIEDCYPDCNGSLRISAGFVQRYTSADAVVHTPHTTLSGLLDKATEAKLNGGGDEYKESEFYCPERLYDLLEADKSGEGVQQVPVCLLYSTDTVGGNSGSPVMNQRGELVAINFDRQRQGLMNEYKWSSKYSRSIGVDVRYILWLIGEYDGATHLVDELIASDDA